jgi:hypothetical protein
MKSLAQRSARSAFLPAPLATETEPVADRVRSEVDRMAAAWLYPGGVCTSRHAHPDTSRTTQISAPGRRETDPVPYGFGATIHCLTGCAIGEILGMVLSTWWGWSNTGNVVLSVPLAFVFGYSLTMLPLLRSGLTLRRSLPLAFASDTLSIATMEVVDTLIIFIVPGAINAGVSDPLFWGSLAGALFVAFWAAFPVNRALIARGKGHAAVHAYH